MDWSFLERCMQATKHQEGYVYCLSPSNTEIMNQILEMALRSYVNPNLNDWSSLLHPFSLAYNNKPHLATSFAPCFLLYGFTPLTPSNLLHPSQDFMHRPQSSMISPSPQIGKPPITLIDHSGSENNKASDFVDEFQMYRDLASQSIQFSQVAPQRIYNKGHMFDKLEVGNSILVNPHSLSLLNAVKERGKKLLMKYNGPFEISQKIGPSTYCLQMPASYGLHPILNLAHLECYHVSEDGLGDQPKKPLNRLDFSEVPEYEVELITQERWRKL
jgi:hypothetical protein